MDFGYSPNLPLSTAVNHYDMINDIRENIKQNFKNLVLTHPGERIMLPDFGVGVRQYLFEIDKDVIFDQLSQDIVNQAGTYMPFIEIEEIVRVDNFNGQDLQDRIGIVIFYSVDEIGLNDQLNILA